MKKLFILLVMTLILGTVTGCTGQKEAKSINVSAAISLNDALQEIGKIYQEKHPGLDLVFNFASSGTLQKQIEQGAATDLFISAGQPQMDALEGKALLKENSRIDLLSNQLVLVVPKGNVKALHNFKQLTAKTENIAIGDPGSVPAGKYAQETLQNLGLWNQLRPKLIYTKDVRQVLTYVESNNVDAGLVYKSDALISKKVQVVTEAPADSHAPIVYPAALIKSAKSSVEAATFLEYLQSPEAQQIFSKYGFTKS